jgi:hypothetical protein
MRTCPNLCLIDGRYWPEQKLWHKSYARYAPVASNLLGEQDSYRPSLPSAGTSAIHASRLVMPYGAIELVLGRLNNEYPEQIVSV